MIAKYATVSLILLHHFSVEQLPDRPVHVFKFIPFILAAATKPVEMIYPHLHEKAKRLTLLLAAVLLVGIGLLPILVMLAKSLSVDGHLSFDYYRSVFSSSRSWGLLKQSLVLAFLTTLSATTVGLPLGILLGKSDLPWRRRFIILLTVPLLLPPYITAVAWFNLLGREGLVARILGSNVAETSSAWLFSLTGCVLVLFTAFLPIIILLTMAALKMVHPQMEEAASLVARWPRVLYGVTVPAILPGVLFAATLVFLLSLGELSVPLFLRFEVFPVESFTQFSAFYNFGAATAAAVPLAVITFLILAAERFFFPAQVYPLQAVQGESLTLKLGSLRGFHCASVGLFCFIIIVVPYAALIAQSASVRLYVDAFTQAGDSLARSLAYAVIGGSLLTLLGFFLGYLIQTKTFCFWRGIDFLTLCLFALPSTVVGIGLISLWNRPATSFIYGTPVIIILGYLAQYTALSSRITAATLARIPSSMEQAAQIVGAGWFRRVIFILAPLARSGLIAAWLVAYIFCLRDTGLSMMVYPPGHDTFPVRIFTLMANSPGELIAALCVILVTATLLPLAGLGWVIKSMRFK